MIAEPAHPHVDPGSSLFEVEGLVQNLVASWQPMTRLVQRRGGHRVHFPRRILLCGLGPRFGANDDLVQSVTGKDISLEGVSFIHTAPIADSQVALSFELPDGMSESIVTRLIWCRFTREGWYESGGRFLRPLSPARLRKAKS